MFRSCLVNRKVWCPNEPKQLLSDRAIAPFWLGFNIGFRSFVFPNGGGIPNKGNNGGYRRQKVLFDKNLNLFFNLDPLVATKIQALHATYSILIRRKEINFGTPRRVFLFGLANWIKRKSSPSCLWRIPRQGWHRFENCEKGNGFWDYLKPIRTKLRNMKTTRMAGPF